MRGPWYISVAAVRDYLWLTRQPDVTDGPEFDAAEDELIEMAEAAVASARTAAPTTGGGWRYKGGSKRNRLHLIVNDPPPGVGDRPALVEVQWGYDDGRGLAPHRRHNR